MVAPSINSEIENRAREIVFMLMERPITEDVALRVGLLDGFKKLEIVNGNWVGLKSIIF